MGEITWGTATATLAALLVLLLPGGALLSLLPPRRAEGQPAHQIDAASSLIVAAGLTLALVPVMLLAFYLLGVRVGPGTVLILLAASAALILWRRGAAWRAWLRQQRGIPWRQRLRGLDAPRLALVLVAGLVVGARLWPVRGIHFGLWGDSYHHTLITQLILDNGGLFQSWEPYAPLRSFTYHFGFHANAAVLQWASGWLTGNATPRVVVLAGQFLNALAVLGLYPLALRLSGRRWAGVLAVLIAGLLMPMPAYYVNWGRYTQLAGQAVLPAVLWLLLAAVDRPLVGPRAWLLAGLAVGGLGLTHYRIVFFVPCFLLPYLLWRLARDRRRAGRLIAGLSAAAGVSLLVVAPWLWNLSSGAYPALAAAVATDPNAGQTFSQTYLFDDLSQWVPWPVAWLALLGAGLALIQRRVSSLIVAWLAVLLLLANPHWLGLPGTGLLDNFTLVIGLYQPAALLAGSLLAEGIEWAAQRWRAAGAVALVLVAGAGLLGAPARATVLDPQFQMVTTADATAMDWIRANTPTDARFLVNGFLAFSGNYTVGADAGWWLPLLAGRANSVPPILYASEAAADPGYFDEVNALTRYVEAANLDSAATVAWLRQQGISHVYIGDQGGRVGDPDTPLLDAEVLLTSPYYRVVYHEGGVWIFELDPEGGSGD